MSSAILAPAISAGKPGKTKVPVRRGSVRRLSAGQLIDLAAHERVGQSRVASDDRLGEQADGLLDQLVEFLRAELLDHERDGGLLADVLIDLASLLLSRRYLSKSRFQLPPPTLQATGHLRQEVVPVLDP